MAVKSLKKSLIHPNTTNPHPTVKEVKEETMLNNPFKDDEDDYEWKDMKRWLITCTLLLSAAGAIIIFAFVFAMKLANVLI